MYDGPIIDSHHHLWDLSTSHYPWLTGADDAIKALGNIDYLRRDYLPPDYAADSAGQGITATVHVEAVWDPARDPVEQTDWIDALPRPPGLAARYVVAASLVREDVAAVLERQATFPCVAAVRETIRWHPDPAKRWTRAGLVNDPAWRRGLVHLGRTGLALDLLMNPHQAVEVAALAAEVPGQTFIINHCCTPNDRDEAGMARWREGLVAMARHPNVAIKLSNFGAYSPAGSAADDRATLLTIIDAFGPGRCLFGTDYPVARRTMTFAAICDRFREVVSGFTPTEQRALFHDNAARLYRMDQ